MEMKKMKNAKIAQKKLKEKRSDISFILFLFFILFEFRSKAIGTLATSATPAHTKNGCLRKSSSQHQTVYTNWVVWPDRTIFFHHILHLLLFGAEASAQCIL